MFNFCQRGLEFVEFWLGVDSIWPSNSTSEAIKEFPRPTNIMDVCSFLGLIKQVAWAFSKTAAILSFQELMSPTSEFLWTADLQHSFE